MFKKIFPIFLILIAILGVNSIMANTNFEILSNSFKNGDTLPMEQVLNAHGCTGSNISPHLKWQNTPEGTKSFALLVHDPDAPMPNGWWHWLVLNIPKNKTEFQKGETLNAPMLETITDFETGGYGGACPPIGHGIHHYNFTIHALDVEKLDIDKNTNPNEVEKLVKSHSLASATITALYQR